MSFMFLFNYALSASRHVNQSWNLVIFYPWRGPECWNLCSPSVRSNRVTQWLWNSGVLFSHLNKQAGQSGVFESCSDCLSDSESPVSPTRGLYACLCLFVCVCVWPCVFVCVCEAVLQSLLSWFLPVLSVRLRLFFFSYSVREGGALYPHG